MLILALENDSNYPHCCKVLLQLVFIVILVYHLRKGMRLHVNNGELTHLQ